MLAATPGSQNCQNTTGCTPFYRGLFFIGFWELCWLGFYQVALIYHQQSSDTCTGEMSLLVTSSRSQV